MFGDNRVVFSSDIRHQLANGVADLMHAIGIERQLGDLDPAIAAEDRFNVLWAEIERAVAYGAMLFDEDHSDDELLPPQQLEVIVDLEPGEMPTPTRW